MIILLLFLTNITQKQFEQKPIIFDGNQDIYTTDYLFISTPYGIYTFDRSSETWSRITQTNGLLDNKIKLVGIDEGIIWVVTANGVACADVRINDWQTYEFPGDIQGMDFDDEYVWLGGDFGLKRFDKYVEEWEDVCELQITHLLREDKYIWLTTDSAILRYNLEFERVEKTVGPPRSSYRFIINTPGRIWFLAEDKFVAYEKENEIWNIYPNLEIKDYSNLGDSLFVVSRQKVYFYEPKADDWRLFRELEDVKGVNGISANNEELLLATDNGLIIYNREEKSRKFYNHNNGIENDSLTAVYSGPHYIFVINKLNIEYFNRETGLWRAERLEPSGEKKEKIFYLDEAGGHARLIKNTDIKLQGRAYYSTTTTWNDSTTATDYENINMKLIGQHTSNRLFSLYYDDADKEQIMYGFGYRGANRDLLYRVDGGFLRSEYYEFDFVPRLSIFGGNAKIKVKEHNINIQGGQLKSTLRNDFFYGHSTEKEFILHDINYQKNTFYYIDSVESFVARGYDTLFIDDRSSITNSIKTRLSTTIAGITGDFDPLINGVDYHINYEKGIIHILTPRAADDIIVLLINGREIVIQSDSVRNHMLENIYYLGPEIIPGSFSLSITDTLNQIHPLAEFGLDNDSDGVVDAEFINYDLGYLSFPARRPFPDTVYDDTLNLYNLNIEFRSRSSFFYLSYRPIVKVSEKVYVDGELMTRGIDYIIDYTSGILLFLREGAVSDFSEIEVRYSSVERTRTDPFYAVQPNIQIREKVHIAPGFSVVDTQRVGHLSGKIEIGSPGKEIKFIPQFAIDTKEEWAQAYSLIATYKIFSINTDYTGYSGDFQSFGLNEEKYGRLKQNGAVSLGVEPISGIKLEGKFKEKQEIDSTGTQYTCRYSYGKVNYTASELPSGYLIIGRDFLPDYRKDRIQFNTNYSTEFLRSKIKINSMVHNAVLDFNTGGDNRNFEYIINTNLMLPFSVMTDIYLRRNDLYSDESKIKEEEELRGTINMDILSGLYYTGNYNLQSAAFAQRTFQDMTLKGSFFNNLNIAPGQWVPVFSIVNFSLGLSRNFEEYLRNVETGYKKPIVVFSPLETGLLSSINTVNSYYVIIQLIPFSEISLWGKHTFSESGNGYYGMPLLKNSLHEEIKLEIEPGDLGRFTTVWNHRYNEGYPAAMLDNIYFEWNRPWSQLLRTKFTTNYQSNRYDYNFSSTEDYGIKTIIEFLLRFTARSFVTLDFGGAKQNNYLNGESYTLISGLGCNLNIFKFLYLQCDYTVTYPLDSTTTHFLTAKITGQF
ncbi:MAG TPA: hypothetical protein ENI34_00590 [candidate division WOR-3 bacterium]|uniref:Uncharacterized protein n=1 Tax=candidate division WOR-3 bacterium TaxID=2052148 RepID=A0A9C9JZB7_UNCW3|nr:hypothetical protein [candidate division WOR-3 bacterium]